MKWSCQAAMVTARPRPKPLAIIRDESQTNSISVYPDGSVKVVTSSFYGVSEWYMLPPKAAELSAAMRFVQVPKVSPTAVPSTDWCISVLSPMYDALITVRDGRVGTCPSDADFDVPFACRRTSRQLALTVLLSQARMLDDSVSLDVCLSMLEMIGALLDRGGLGQ
jgi:hypothetical protein